MKNETLIFEYGKPFDPQSMVAPPDTTEVELEMATPALGTKNTSSGVGTCSHSAAVAAWRALEPPMIEFTPEETRIWREVSPKLDELHLKYASDFYLGGKHELAISREEIPQLGVISERLRSETNMHLVPAEGALPYRDLLPVHCRPRFPGDPVSPARLASGVHP